MGVICTAFKNIIRILALSLVLVAAITLAFPDRVMVNGNTGLQAGETDISTVIDPPGSYDSPEDLNTLNTVNRLTTTYN